jgi:hypothetical protein
VTRRHDAEEQDPQRLRRENLNTPKTPISLSLFVSLNFFLWLCFFVTVYRTQPFTLSPFLLSPLLSSTQPYFPLLLHPLPNGFHRSSSTRVATGPLTYSLN